MTLTIVKIGGSLYDLPDLGPRLRNWLKTLSAERVLLVPGGGPTAEVIREFDRVHGLGEKIAHHLALRSLTLNAWFLAELLGTDGGITSFFLAACGLADRPLSRKRQPGIPPSVPSGAIPVLDPCRRDWEGFALLDGYAFGQEENVSRLLPACWEATSDSVAAVAAIILQASELILLKSIEEGEGLVDPIFSRLVEGERFAIRIVNLRRLQSEPEA